MSIKIKCDRGCPCDHFYCRDPPVTTTTSTTTSTTSITTISATTTTNLTTTFKSTTTIWPSTKDNAVLLIALYYPTNGQPQSKSKIVSFNGFINDSFGLTFEEGVRTDWSCGATFKDTYWIFGGSSSNKRQV